jgi:hypothetical protein
MHAVRPVGSMACMVWLRVENSEQIPQDDAFVFGMLWMRCSTAIDQVNRSTPQITRGNSTSLPTVEGAEMLLFRSSGGVRTNQGCRRAG